VSVKIMGLVWDLVIPQNEKLVLLAYADHASHDGSNIYPAVKTIAKKTGYSERSVQVITRSIEDRGYLCSDGQGPKGTNKWRIPLHLGVIMPMTSRGAESAPVQSETQGGAENDVKGCRKEPKGVKRTAPEPSLTVNESSVKETDAKIIFKSYENNIAMITEKSASFIGDALDTYPAQWILDAIGEAVKHNARNWAYIEKILKTWKARGRANDKPLDKMSDVDKELLRMDIKPAHQVIEEMGLNDVSDEEQKIKNQKALAKIKETE